jgi:hypothetical protein
MDTLILAHTAVSFCLFFGLHIAVFRRIRESEVMAWLVYVFGIAGGIHIAIPWIWAAVAGISLPVGDTVAEIAVSFVLYGLAVATFVLAVFGITVTSLRIQMLLAVDAAGDRGVSGRQLRQRYGRDAVVARRLERLSASGELVRHGDRYGYGGKRTFFVVHTYFLVLLNRLYGNTVYRTG